ncbi:MAG: hypothetical protein ACYC6S_04520, partial [Desulfobulbia bacterium]
PMALSRERCGARSTPLRIASLRIFFIGRFPSIVLIFHAFNKKINTSRPPSAVKAKVFCGRIWCAERRDAAAGQPNFF